jgi:tRNA (guanine37-N1)-methyltransferase
LGKRLRRMLAGAVSPEDIASVYGSYDVVGDIAVVRLTEASRRHSRSIAEAVMAVHGNVRTVLAQVGDVAGEFRLRRLELVAGEAGTLTVHRESGCVFAVDVERCYFSTRLSYERMRVAGLVRDGETVVNMFAGVGCFSVVMARHSGVGRVYSVDVNPAAFELMRENVRLNGVYGRVVPVLGDAGKVVDERLRHVADRVLMPLPAKAFDYLPHAVLALKPSGGWVHYYDFEHAGKGEDVVEKVRLKVSAKLHSLCGEFDVPFGRVVRSTGPNWYQVVLDIRARPLSADA